MQRNMTIVLVLSTLTGLSACGGGHVRIERETPANQTVPAVKNNPSVTDGTSRRGGYYQDDGPGENPPPNLELIPDAEPRLEPLAKGANRPYTVFGKQYVPDVREMPFRQRGVASWYGRKFHGQRTSSGEIYDMYAMTAAHPTLPIPSYVRVTNPANGKTVVLRVNDRGPFHSGRIMDLSYTAAFKLGYANRGSILVEVERILPAEIAQKKSNTNTIEAVLAASNVVPETAPVLEPVKQAPSVATPDETPLTGIFIQLGAFSTRDKAENQRVEIYQQLTWLNASIQIEARDNLHRLLVGPYPSREAASAVAERIGLPVKALIVTR